ncbi:flagellar filament capping protein FliD [Neiella marina]|uniref:Flagellar hook-associated protein 2 n=1 Tax=Neiella holothuriorum TaxID=2870530 RepID=A0ABS7EES0_9GAMM|nr:flagellar filament capping protein FliD [Neiella holothuriorum]MBW8190813.1 flagellar filament capping protein FliD [Neiella holothuriorum]
MTTISTPGIGSGLDINTIVSAYIDAQTVPFEARMEEKESTYTSQITGYGTMRNSVDALQSAIDTLTDTDNYGAMQVSMGSADYFSATIDTTATPGSFDIQVQQLAEAQKLTSGAFVADDPTGEGSLEISLGDSTFTIDVAADATLDDIKEAINDSDLNPGISASIVTDDDGAHLVLNSSQTGLTNQINITAYDATDTEIVDGTGLGKLQFDSSDVANSQMAETQAAQDAILVIDGSLTITNDSNTFEEAIEGVTFTVTDVHEDGDSTSITISENTAQLENAIKGFVDAYNSYLETSKSLQYTNVDAEITAALAGDATARMMDRQFRTVVSSVYGDSDFNSLTSIGITVNEDGYFDVDSDVLSDAVANNTDDLMTFFIGTDDEPGMGAKLQAQIEIYSGSDGILSTRVDTLTGQVERLDDERETFAERIETQEAQLYSKFNAMDATVAALNNTLSFVTSQLDNLPGVISNDD